MIITLPLRRMTLHFSQIGLTDGLTFMIKTSYCAAERAPCGVPVRPVRVGSAN
jgi:hypothetical protein